MVRPLVLFHRPVHTNQTVSLPIYHPSTRSFIIMCGHSIKSSLRFIGIAFTAALSILGTFVDALDDGRLCCRYKDQSFVSFECKYYSSSTNISMLPRILLHTKPDQLILRNIETYWHYIHRETGLPSCRRSSRLHSICQPYRL